MTPIPQNYKQAGYFMEFVKRERNAVMYKALKATYWEVHAVRVEKPRTIFGKDYPEREVLASNEDFGTHGWACVTLESAEMRFDNILATYWASREN